MSSSPSTVVRASRSGLNLFASRWYGAGLQFVATVVVARLLSPTDFGLIAMVAVVTGLGALLMDFGLSSAAIQAKNLSNGQKSWLFWITSLMGVILASMLVIMAPIIADFYREPRVAAVARWLSLTFLLNGLATQFQAELTRNLRFSALAVAGVASATTNLVATVGLALLGLGYWALVTGMLASSAVFGIIVISLSRWKPGRCCPLRELLPLLRFGGGLTAVQLLNYASRSISVVMIGRLTGAGAAGLYSRAYNLLLIPIQQINSPLGSIMVPLLSRLQEDREAYRRTLNSATLLISYSTVPVMAVAGGLAFSLVPLVYGGQWDGAAPIFAILAVGGVARAYSNLIGWVANSLAIIEKQLSFTVLSQVVTVPALAVGALWGPLGVAAAYSVTAALAVPVGLWWILRQTDVHLAALVRVAAPAVVLSVFLFAGLFVLDRWAVGLGNGLTLVLGLLAGLGTAGAACALPPVRRDAVEVRRLIKRLRRG